MRASAADVFRRLACAGACGVAIAGACASPTPKPPTPSTVEIATAPHAEAEERSKVALPVAEYDPVRPGPTYLHDDFEKRFPHRAMLDRVNNVYWEETALADAGVAGEWETITEDEGSVLVVGERRPKHLRVISEDYGIRAVAYVKREDFELVTARDSVVQLRHEKKLPPGIGVHVAPGTKLEWTDQSRAHRAVRVSDDGLDFAGWISNDDLGLVFVPPTPEPGKPDAYVADGTAVFAAPGGDVIARLSGSDNFEVQTVGGQSNGHQRVVIRRPPYRVEGFVAEKQLHRTEIDNEDLGAGGLGLSGWGGSGRKFTLDAGDPIYSSATGEQIAVVIKAGTRVSDGGQSESERRFISFPMSPWSFVDAWIDEPPTP